MRRIDEFMSVEFDFYDEFYSILALKFDKDFTLSLLKISFAGSCVVLWFNIFPIKHIQGFFVQMFSAGILYVCLMFMLGVVRFKDIKEQNFV